MRLESLPVHLIWEEQNLGSRSLPMCLGARGSLGIPDLVRFCGGAFSGERIHGFLEFPQASGLLPKLKHPWSAPSCPSPGCWRKVPAGRAGLEGGGSSTAGSQWDVGRAKHFLTSYFQVPLVTIGGHFEKGRWGRNSLCFFADRHNPFSLFALSFQACVSRIKNYNQPRLPGLE